MVGGPAAADAVARAGRLPELRVGLHLVVVDGRPVLPAGELGGLVGGDGEFERDLLRAGLKYFLLPAIRRQLKREIRAQFEAFRATGLSLDHVDAHQHMQLHPSVARLLIEIGRDYGITAMRVPAEPAAPLRAALPGEPYRPPFYRPWVAGLRRRVRRAGLGAADQVFGIAWSGGMTEERVLRLLPNLPEGVSEIYFHPYRHGDELAALTSPAVASRVAELGIGLIGYRDIAP
jgi:hopanoid biosynthesis associated protein HpnK